MLDAVPTRVLWAAVTVEVVLLAAALLFTPVAATAGVLLGLRDPTVVHVYVTHWQPPQR